MLDPAGDWEPVQVVLPHMLHYDVPAQVLQALHPLEPGHGVEQLDPHRTKDGSAVEEEQVSARPGVLHSILYEVHDCVAFKFCETAKAEVALVMFYSDMPDKTIEFESEAEDVVMVTAVPHHKAAIRLPTKNALCTLP